jgi:oligoendopeptidase F
MATTLTGAEAVEWDLSDLYQGPDDPRLDRDVDDAVEAAKRFAERYRGRVARLSAAELAEAVAEVERIKSQLTRADGYARLRFAADTSDPARGALMQRIRERETEAETELLFFDLEWAGLEDAQAERILADPAIAKYANVLRSERRYRPHLLSEPEERLEIEKSLTGTGAWTRLFNELTAAIRVDVDGQDLSLDEALAKLYQPDREVRQRAHAAVTEALEPGLRTRGFILNTIALDRSIEDRLRGFPTWISARNLSNELPDEAAQALVDAVRDRSDIAQRFYALKAKLLGLDRLADYDRFAPVSGDQSEIVTWNEACEIVLDSYNGFSPKAGELVGRFFDRGWIDAPARPGKTPGAFCATLLPDVHPYVLMNYAGERRSILTLAHELGHGLHGILAQDLGLMNARTPLTLAETASVFGEALVFEKLMERETDPRARLDLLTGRIEDAIATVFRQIALNRFEHAVHTGRREEGELSPERVGELWYATQAEMLGDTVEVTDGYRRWWSYVPHFIVAPGYVYAYAFGYLFSLAIYRRYQVEGQSLVEPYFDLLRAGGSAPPPELAAKLGFDLGDTSIWNDGLDAIDGLVTEAEQLAAELA